MVAISAEEKKDKLMKAAFAVYAAIMLWLLFGQRIGGARVTDYWATVSANVNFVPLETVGRFVKSMLHPKSGEALFEAVKNLGGNVILFVPFGFLIPAVFKKCEKPLHSVLFGAACMVAVEFLQLFTLLGKCDIDDVILNVIGILLGRFIFYFVQNRTKSVDFFKK